MCDHIFRGSVLAEPRPQFRGQITCMSDIMSAIILGIGIASVIVTTDARSHAG